MYKNVNVFGKFENYYRAKGSSYSDKNVFVFYYDDFRFYCIKNGPSVTGGYKYKQFFQIYYQFDKNRLRFFSYDNASSICRYIYRHMKNRDCYSMTIEDVIELMNENTIVYIFKNKLHLDIASSYPSVSFEREYCNKNTNTFDFITISFSMVRSGRTSQEIIEWLKKNKNHMQNLITYTIQIPLQDRFGLSMNYIQVDSAILTKDCRIVYKLSVKELEMEEF